MTMMKMIDDDDEDNNNKEEIDIVKGVRLWRLIRYFKSTST